MLWFLRTLLPLLSLTFHARCQTSAAVLSFFGIQTMEQMHFSHLLGFAKLF